MEPKCSVTYPFDPAILLLPASKCDADRSARLQVACLQDLNGFHADGDSRAVIRRASSTMPGIHVSAQHHGFVLEGAEFLAFCVASAAIWSRSWNLTASSPAIFTFSPALMMRTSRLKCSVAMTTCGMICGASLLQAEIRLACAPGAVVGALGWPAAPPPSGLGPGTGSRLDEDSPVVAATARLDHERCAFLLKEFGLSRRELKPLHHLRGLLEALATGLATRSASRPTLVRRELDVRRNSPFQRAARRCIALRQA